MCSECRRYVGHHPSCPYADEPVPVKIGECEICGKDIMTSEDYVEHDGYKYHYACLSELSVREVLDVLEIDVKVAESY